MIDVDISNIWGNIEFRSLISMEGRLSGAASALKEQSQADEFGWKLLLEHSDTVFTVIADAVTEMMTHSTSLVVIGTAIVNQYIKAALSYQSSVPGDCCMSILCAGDSLSSDSLQEITSRLQNTDFSVLVADGLTTIEEAIALRKLKWLLCRKYGPEQALGRIYFAAERPVFKVFSLAQNQSIRPLIALGEKSQRFPAAACMIPLAAAGLDPELLTDGVRRACQALQNPDIENPVWLYTAARVLLREQEIGIEELHIEESVLESFGHWCCQLFAETQHGSGQWITSILNPYAGYSFRAHTFETVLEPEERTGDSVIELDLQDADGLNYLAGVRLSQIEACVSEELSRVKAEKHYPAIMLRTGKHSLRLFGYLTYFFQLAAGLSGQILKSADTGPETDASPETMVLESLERKFKA